MFTSISRGRVRFRSTYICTSCLSSISPHGSQHSARQISNRESFSTSSNNRQNGHNDTSDNTKTTKKSGGRVRRRRSATSIPHSNDAIFALKRPLQNEESDPKASKKALVRKATSKNHAPASASKADLSSLKEGLAEEANAPKTPKLKSQKEKKVLEEVGEFSNRTDNDALFWGPTGKPAKTGNPASAKIKTPAKKPAKKTIKPPSIEAKSQGSALREEPTTVTVVRSSKKSTSNRPVKLPTEVQRRKVEAVLLGVKNKQAAILGKKIDTHIHAIGENETREALVKIIEDGNIFKSDVAAARRLRSKISPKSNSVQQPRAKRRLGKPSLIRNIRSTEKPNSRRLTPGTIEAVRPSDLGTFMKLKDAMKAGPPRSGVGKKTQPVRIKSKAGINVVTGPLKERNGFEIQTLNASDLTLVPIDRAQPQVPSLSYGLERVLFNPGVYHLQDPRSRVFNFDPYLQKIMPVDEFDFTALKKYITSSRDDILLATAKEEEKKYTGSTSSMTAALAHFHFLLSQWRAINTETLSRKFPVEFESFTALQRGPSAVFLRWKDGVYAIDADKQFDTANILATLGKSMEKLLTLPTDDFEKYRKQNSDQISLEEREAAEAFNYTTMGDFLLRSQLDAYDPRLPGTGMFDLKTRAVVSIRMDLKEYEHGMDYEIRKQYGEWESYEREYYDMIRAAFLKYSLQVRMGRMDGIFVAFHNTQRIFGFQYISLPELDLALHGTEDTTTGDLEFKMSLDLLNKVLDRATVKYPEKSLRLHFETRGTDVPFMYIFAEPMEDEQINIIQESNKAVVEEFEKRVLGLDGELSEEEKKAAEWASMRAKVEENMEKDELDIEEARSIAESLIDESPLFRSDELSAEGKEKLINDLLESVDFDEDDDGGALNPGGNRKYGKDGAEGASADSEGTERDEDEDDLGEESENEGEEEHDDDDEIEGDAENGDELDDSDNLMPAEETELLNDNPIDDVAQDTDALTSEILADESKEVDEEVETERHEDPDEKVDQRETDKDGGASIEDTENDTASLFADTDGTELTEDKDLAPDDAGYTDETRNSAPVHESATESETAAYTPLSGEDAGDPKDETEVLAMTLTIRNKVNGKYVARPEKLSPTDSWTIEYALEEVAGIERSQRLYKACQTRRAKALSFAKKDEANSWNDAYIENLRKLSKRGKKWRAEQNKLDEEQPMKVLDKDDASQKAWG